MYNRQFHSSTNTVTREKFLKPSLTEPDNAMSIPEIIARYVRGHGLAVPLLPDSSDQSAREDGFSFQDDPDMFSDEHQAYLAAQAAAESAAAEAGQDDSKSPTED